MDAGVTAGPTSDHSVVAGDPHFEAVEPDSLRFDALLLLLERGRPRRASVQTDPVAPEHNVVVALAAQNLAQELQVHLPLLGHHPQVVFEVEVLPLREPETDLPEQVLLRKVHRPSRAFGLLLAPALLLALDVQVQLLDDRVDELLLPRGDRLRVGGPLHVARVGVEHVPAVARPRFLRPVLLLGPDFLRNLEGLLDVEGDLLQVPADLRGFVYRNVVLLGRLHLVFERGDLGLLF